MFMTNVCPSPELEAAAKRNSYRDRLAELADEELIKIYRTAEERFGDKRFNAYLLGCQPEEFYKGAAAVDVLRDRHGDEFVEELTGVPQPKTLVGKILRYFSW
jgi:hypothetical protein